MKICIVGGGHIGTAMACYFKRRVPDAVIVLQVRDATRFAPRLKCNDIEGGFSYCSKPDLITSDYSRSITGADVVYIALPHFLIEDVFKAISPYVNEGAYVGVVPGSGGCEFYFEKIFGDRAKLFGFQRVPFTSKLVKYGEEVNLKSWKPLSVIGTLFSSDLDQAIQLVEACGLKTAKAANFMAISMAPSNPILHTSRIYELFGSSDDRKQVFKGRRKFYVGWTDAASRIMLEMDAELHGMMDAVGEALDLSAIIPLSVHYEASSVEAMTAKINSIPTFQTVYAPMVPAGDNKSGDLDGNWIADVQSRMFTEDFPWGLAIIKGYCEIFGVKTPRIDEVLHWYERYMGVQYFDACGNFAGNDLAKTGCPQAHGIITREDAIALYNR